MADVAFTHLDDPLFDGSDATKRDLIGYCEAVQEQLLAAVRDRPLSVMRVRPGQAPFMQKNLPKYTPDFVRRVEIWAERSHRSVSYALCDDLATLLWSANQRAIEYHVQLWRTAATGRPDFLVLDLDPPEDADGDVEAGFRQAVGAALLVRQALTDLGLSGALKTSGAKGVHVFVPIDLTAAGESGPDDAAAATRAIAVRAARLDPALATTEYIKADRGPRVFVDSTRAHNATVIAAYSPRLRPGVPVSFPLGWDDAEQVLPRDFTLATAPGLLDGADPWRDALPAPQTLPADLVAEGHEIPIARVAAMHEGKRRKRAAEQSD